MVVIAVLHLVIDTLYAVLLWIIVFIPSSELGVVIGSRIASGHRRILSIGIVTQTLFIVFSLLIIHLFKLGDVIVFTIDQESLTESMVVFALLLVVSLVMNWANKKYVGDMGPISTQLLGESKVLVLTTLLVIAPLGEEVLFRGLLEGYLVIHNEPVYAAVTIPALLFTLIHLQPLRKNPVLLVEILIIGLLLSYIRIITTSLIPVIAGHSALNTGGILVYSLMTKNHGYRQKANNYGSHLMAA